MNSYLHELLHLVTTKLPLDPSKCGISGHSMGGHGALVFGLKNRDMFTSISAFAPISNPINCPWGQKAFKGYLGDDQNTWEQYDATILAKNYNGRPVDILIDQGSLDNFLIQKQLLPENFINSCPKSINCQYRLQDGYDHSYWFIQTFIDDHLRFHHSHFISSK